MLSRVKSFANDEAGVTMLEYTILLGIITVAAIASIGVAGTYVSTKWAALTAIIAPAK